MPARLVILALLLSLLTLAGCGSIRMQGPFANDPLTGGLDVSTSHLLQVTLPAGMQRYSSHGFLLSGTMSPAGLEVLRGSVDSAQTSQTLFAALQGQGWQLRLNLQKGRRILQVYDNGQDMAVLHYRPQAALTILEIWRSSRMADGAALDIFVPDNPDNNTSDSYTEMPGETYPPLPAEVLDDDTPKPGQVEEWGDTAMQERML